ncbi:MAG: LytR C-terminal domain-containing protein [Desulfobaccales bacterium]
MKFLALAAIFGIGVFSAMVLWGCSGCSRTASEHSNAEGFWGAGVRSDPGDTTRVLRNAHYLKMMGRPEMALKELEGAYHENPRNLKVLDTLARTYEELGEFDRAQKLYQQALTLDSSNEALNNNLCFSYYLTGRYDKAETCFREALAKNPQNLTVRNNLGLLLCRLGRSEEALRLWQESEGAIAAQKKMQQVMVALGQGEQRHYAQTMQPAAAPAPAASGSAPQPGVTPDRTPALAAVPSAPVPQPPTPAAAPAKIQEAGKMAAKIPPAALQDDKEPPVSMTARKAARLPRPELQAAAAKTKSESPAPRSLAKTGAAAVQKKAEAKVLAAAPPAPPEPPPAPPRQAAAAVKKPLPAATPAPPAKPGKTQVAAAPAPGPLAAAKLAQSGLEVVNGTSARDLARHTRSMLVEGGFKVVKIGNYKDYSAEKTVIYYQPGSEEVARVLSAKFFPKASLETGEKFARGADIKILLGRDFSNPEALASDPAPAAEKVAAGVGSGHPAMKPAAPAAAPAPAPAKAPAPASLPVAAAPTPKAAPPETRNQAYLTAAELENTGIDIRNGTPAPDLAHRARTMLSQEGFNVVHIGNHIDFGAEKTIIFYRPGSEKVARNLSAKFFPQSQVEQSAKLPGDVAVKVLLGKDLLQRTDVMAKLSD